MAAFNSRNCDICQIALQQAFSGMNDEQHPKIVPHHRTKDSLVESVMARSCHLCRLILYHLKSHWICPPNRTLFAAAMFQNLESTAWNGPFPFWAEEDADTPTPFTLTAADFIGSDFGFNTFSRDRIVVRSYLRGLPERLDLGIIMHKYDGPTRGISAKLQFDCKALSKGQLETVKPSFWIFTDEAFDVAASIARWNDDMCTLACRDLVKSWLRNCDNVHDACTKAPRGFLPTRLLDLGAVEEQQRVRVVLSEELDPNTRYVSLSHCWGENVPFQLTTSTRDMMQRGFDLTELPPTFQDAIHVARWADVSYIWIDSCCILQYSESDVDKEYKVDWEKEAKMMEHVYKNTYFNISADASENSHGGLFNNRLAYKFSPCSLTMPTVGKIHILPRSDFTNPVAQSPISQRAWVIQERYLSPRVLHFTSDQIFWECSSFIACETFPMGIPNVYAYAFQPYKSLSDNVALRGSHEPDYPRVWGRMCEDYSAARLTYTSDKLIAFSGMAKDFRSRRPSDTYLAGMWKEDLVDSLVWSVKALDGRPLQSNGSRDTYASSYITASPPEHYRAPSWSWLSKDCCIFWSKIRHKSHHLLKLLDASIDLVDENDAMGNMRCGSITVLGFLRAASWRREGDLDMIVLDGKSGKYLHDAPSESSTPDSGTFLMRRDVGLELPTKKIYCLPVRRSFHLRPPLKGVEVIDGLILGDTGIPYQFERLGYFESNGASFRRALTWQLEPLAQELEYPWHGLDLEWGKLDSGARVHDGYYKMVEAVEFTII